MSRGRDSYITPVGFAREPRAEVRRWIGRFFLLLLVVLLGWLLWNRVINPQQDEPTFDRSQTELPAPV